MGQGDFLTPIIERRLASYSRLSAASRHSVVDDLGGCITAVELHQPSYDQTFELVRVALRARGLNAAAPIVFEWSYQYRGFEMVLDPPARPIEAAHTFGPQAITTATDHPAQDDLSYRPTS